MEPILLIMAAGMGSRYGGLKQADPVGPGGEWIIDYSLYDAYQAGFRRAVFVIRKEHLSFFQEKFQGKLPKDFALSFAFQALSDLPDGIFVPEGREKPWGTAHAVYAARKLINAPFAVINADDYYGKEPYRMMYSFLKKIQEKEELAPGASPRGPEEKKDSPKRAGDQYAMAGFLLRHTLSSHGSVARGLCQVSGGELLGIRERTKIFADGKDAYALEEDILPDKTKSQQKIALSGDQLVSMNFWGFPPNFMEALKRELVRFFNEDLKNNPLKAEAYLPSAVERELKEGRARARVLPTQESWMGVTYQEDKTEVEKGFFEKSRAGLYPSPLWG